MGERRDAIADGALSKSTRVALLFETVDRLALKDDAFQIAAGTDIRRLDRNYQRVEESPRRPFQLLRSLLMKRKVLVVDVGGTHVKLLMSSRNEREFPSGPRLEPQQLIAKLNETVRGWKFDRASIGFPAPIRKGRIARNPKHLGKGWIGFNFARALGIPVRVVNDAAMQALGSYRGGRMLFLGLGTGLGSALVWDKTLMPLELGDLPYRRGHIIENYLGIPGLKLLGEKKWKREVAYAATQLRKSFIADYVVLGGGLVHRFGRLPEGTERGQNENAFLGGVRLWEPREHSRELKWLVL